MSQWQQDWGFGDRRVFLRLRLVDRVALFIYRRKNEIAYTAAAVAVGMLLVHVMRAAW